MIFSTTWTVRKCGFPVTGHGTSSVRNVTFSSKTFSVSRIINAPGLDLMAMRGNTMVCTYNNQIQKVRKTKMEYNCSKGKNKKERKDGKSGIK